VEQNLLQTADLQPTAVSIRSRSGSRSYPRSSPGPAAFFESIQVEPAAASIRSRSGSRSYPRPSPGPAAFLESIQVEPAAASIRSRSGSRSRSSTHPVEIASTPRRSIRLQVKAKRQQLAPKLKRLIKTASRRKSSSHRPNQQKVSRRPKKPQKTIRKSRKIKRRGAAKA
jgi:hypothetical protein